MSTKKTSKSKLPTQPTRLTTPASTPTPPVVEEVVALHDLKPVVKKPEYKIVSEKNSRERLEQEVERLLNEGWSLAGGVSVSMYSSPYETVTYFSQSLTKNI